MIRFAFALGIAFLLGSVTIFDFSKSSDISGWIVVDDVVMGGRSNGTFKLNKEGHGLFSGEVSTENNGGFSSVRYNTPAISCSSYSKFVIRLKGDKKDYQFRIKARNRDYFSYAYDMSTTGDWQVIEIPFDDLYATYRGNKLNRPPFNGSMVEEISFLIGNKRNEQFQLEIDRIEIR